LTRTIKFGPRPDDVPALSSRRDRAFSF
jgi:hypothetical protein